MDFSAVCRTCMGTQSLVPIFVGNQNTKVFSKISKAVSITTGISIQFNDGLPQQMCKKCIQLSSNALKFCKKSRKTEQQLRNIIDQYLASDSDLKTEEPALDETFDTEHFRKNEWPDEKKHQRNSSTINTGSNPKSKRKLNSHEKESWQGNTKFEDEDTPLKYLVIPESDTLDIDSSTEAAGNIEIVQYKDEEPDISDITQMSDLVKLESDSDIPLLYIKDDDTGNKVTCQLCQKSLSLRSVAAHMDSRHPGAARGRELCELCGRSFLRGTIARHRKLVHAVSCGSSGYRCGYCKTDFEDRALLVSHVPFCADKKKKRRASKASREVSQCDVCHKSMQKASLRMHKAIKHGGLAPVCDHCGKAFGNKFRLQEHLRAKHGHDKLRCAYCDFQSASTTALRNHERRHRGEKPFVCDSCGAKFHAAYLLTQHKQSHRTEKNVKCPQCPATFKANNSLHMHRSTCHSSAVHRCSMCERTYSCRHYVVKHLRNFHEYRGPVPPLQTIDKPGVEE